MKTLAETLVFVKKAHKGVVDKGGEPYWKHPAEVMSKLSDKAPMEVLQAALLHDVIEDTVFTAQDLLDEGFSKRTVEIVEQLSRPRALPYLTWIKTMAMNGDKDVIAIKLKDIEHNTDERRAENLSENDSVWWRKRVEHIYKPAVAILMDALKK